VGEPAMALFGSVVNWWFWQRFPAWNWQAGSWLARTNDTLSHHVDITADANGHWTTWQHHETTYHHPVMDIPRSTTLSSPVEAGGWVGLSTFAICSRRETLVEISLNQALRPGSLCKHTHTRRLWELF